jgi:hypothetical protein
MEGETVKRGNWLDVWRQMRNERLRKFLLSVAALVTCVYFAYQFVPMFDREQTFGNALASPDYVAATEDIYRSTHEGEKRWFFGAIRLAAYLRLDFNWWSKADKR